MGRLWKQEKHVVKHAPINVPQPPAFCNSETFWARVGILVLNSTQGTFFSFINLSSCFISLYKLPASCCRLSLAKPRAMYQGGVSCILDLPSDSVVLVSEETINNPSLFTCFIPLILLWILVTSPPFLDRRVLVCFVIPGMTCMNLY